MYTNVYTFCSYQSAVPSVLPYPFGWGQHRFIKPIHGNCILSYDSYDCEPFRSKVLFFCFHLLIVINLCLSVLCIKSDFCIYISHIETGIDFANQRDSSDCKLWLRYLRALCVWIIAVPQKISKETYTICMVAFIGYDAVARAVKYLADFAYFRFKDKVPTETEKKTKRKTRKFALVIVIDCYGSFNRQRERERQLCANSVELRNTTS